MQALALLVPPEFAVLLIALAGLALMIGAKKAAGGLFGIAIAAVLLPPFLGPILATFPLWLLLLLGVCFAGFAFRAILELLIGKNAADHTVGTLTAGVIIFLFSLPFRAVRALFRLGAG